MPCRSLGDMTALTRLWPLPLLVVLLAGCGGSETTSDAQAAELAGRIVFDNGDQQLYTINPDGSDRVQIGFGHDLAHWSRDGSRIAMSAETDDNRVTTALVNRDGSGLAVQAIPDPTLSLVCWAWAPANARIACETWDDTRKARPAGIFSVSTSGWDELSRVTRNPFGGHDIPGSYSPDGTRLAFAREDPGREKVAMYVTRRGGGKPKRVSPWQRDISTPDWSPNGRWLIYDNTRGSLMLVRPSGARRHRLRLALDRFAPAFQPAWSPDGRHIVFAMFTPRRNRPDLEGIYTASANGENVRPVATTTKGFFNNPDWGP